MIGPDARYTMFPLKQSYSTHSKTRLLTDMSQSATTYAFSPFLFPFPTHFSERNFCASGSSGGVCCFPSEPVLVLFPHSSSNSPPQNLPLGYEYQTMPPCWVNSEGQDYPKIEVDSQVRLRIIGVRESKIPKEFVSGMEGGQS